MKNTVFLSDTQQRMVAINLHIVKRVLRDSIIVNECIFGFGYDDLYQEGCIWLCKAVATYDKMRNVKFETYAYTVVSNGLRTYCRLMCAKQRRILTVPLHTEEDGTFALEKIADSDSFDTFCSDLATFDILGKMKNRYHGTVRLGIEALEWKAKGFTGREIADMYGVQPNLVGAWISRAASKLKQNKEFMQFCGKTVETNTD